MSSSSSVTTSTVNGTTRVTGLSSGIDVDSIVEQLMTAEKSKLNKLQQKEQLAQWRQESYRSITSDIKAFSSKYFDITSSSSLLTKSNYLKYAVTSSSTAITAAYTSDATSGNHTIKVTQLATAATLKSGSSISKEVQGSSSVDYTSLSGKSIVITLDGTAKTVDLSNVTGFSSLQSAIEDAVGEGKLNIERISTADGSVLEDTDTTTDYVLSITSADSGVQKITISAPASGSSGLTSLGFSSDSVLSNRLSTSSTLADIAAQLKTTNALTFNEDGQMSLTINGTEFTFDQDDTLNEMMTEINNSDAGVAMKYNELSGKLTLTADETGTGNTLLVSEGEGSNFLNSLLSEATAGVDAKVTIDGQSITRSSNKITVDGVTYTVNQDTSDEVVVSLTQDTDAVYDLISSFVEDYNSLISTINSALSESYDSDYPPLTDDQKADMTDEEIEKWEAKAKTGIIKNDSILTGFLRDLRMSLIDSVSGSSSSIFDIGFSTGTYDEQGKLYIDEDTLKEAIESDPEGVMNLFSQQSTSYPGTTKVRSLTTGQLATRYKEEGIAYRFYDMLQKNISSIRDTNGNKGLLLEKAGMENDASDSENSLSTLLEKYAEEIEKEQDRLDAKEESLYNKYSALETYISKMNTQLSSLSSYLSDSSS